MQQQRLYLHQRHFQEGFGLLPHVYFHLQSQIQHYISVIRVILILNQINSIYPYWTHQHGFPRYAVGHHHHHHHFHLYIHHHLSIIHLNINIIQNHMHLTWKVYPRSLKNFTIMLKSRYARKRIQGSFIFLLNFVCLYIDRFCYRVFWIYLLRRWLLYCTL